MDPTIIILPVEAEKESFYIAAFNDTTYRNFKVGGYLRSRTNRKSIECIGTLMPMVYKF